MHSFYFILFAWVQTTVLFCVFFFVDVFVLYCEFVKRNNDR